jgi:hypothetical protein
VEIAAAVFYVASAGTEWATGAAPTSMGVVLPHPIALWTTSKIHPMVAEPLRNVLIIKKLKLSIDNELVTAKCVNGKAL